jgi:hypothetical protein
MGGKSELFRIPHLPFVTGMYPFRNDGAANNGRNYVTGGRDLTLVNSPGLVAGGGITLNGTNQYAYAAADAGFNFGTGDFAIEAVFNPSATSGNVIASNYQSASAGWSLYLADNVVKFFATGNGVDALGVTTVTTSTLHHIVAQRASGTLQIYLDGSLDVSAAFGDSMSSTAIMAIGRLGSFSGDYFSGTIYSVNIINGAAFTASEAYARFARSRAA